jgi:glycosyltransferase involved in cell wall biosynthesis
MSNQQAEKVCADQRVPRVSVLIPTYRRNHFLVAALRSVEAQTFGDFEVVISDNADDPNTRQLVAGFSDPRLKYRCNSPAVNVFENHLSAWREARGEFIAFLHDDDEWEPTFLATLVKALDEHPQCVVAFSEQLLVGPSGEPLPQKTQENKVRWNRQNLTPGVHRPFWDLLAHQSVPIVMGGIFRRGVISPGDIPKQSHTALDFWMVYALCRSGAGLYYVADPLMHYRTHAGSETARPSDVRLGPVYCWETLLKEPQIRPYRRVVHNKAAEAHTHASTLLLISGRRWRARWHALRAVMHGPTLRRIGLMVLSCLPNKVARRAVQWLLRLEQSTPQSAPSLPVHPAGLARGIPT